ncbi:MAG: adenosylcobinamide-GDP ribazoletransferase [Candidatus Nanopelagicales bacterium]|nr:adenosylcobinamide-GDP ribazoletransferase [Candidatus Nanopelagicales bacterium]MDP4974850.1 adenosylcobinamide-GDP ribazoletransferase [Candidatus Nanopelagicales bacterium]
MRALRLTFGLLTVIPVGAIGDVDRHLARKAILLAPLVGLVLGALAALVVAVVHALVPSTLGALLAAVLAVALLAYLTRALHLDGLADTADALGSGKPADAALEIARRGDVGPFGVVTLVLVLLMQVTALAIATEAGWGGMTVVIAVVTGRAAVIVACTRGIPAARPEGLGALVAGTIPRVASAAWVIVIVIGAFGVGTWLTPDAAWTWPLAVAVGLAVAALLVRRAARRLGGVTGDVMGATVETASTTALLVAALTYASALTS